MTQEEVLPRTSVSPSVGERKHTFYSHHLLCDPAKYRKAALSRPEPKYLRRDRVAAGGARLAAPATQQRRSWVGTRGRGSFVGDGTGWHPALTCAQLPSLSRNLSASAQSSDSFRETPPGPAEANSRPGRRIKAFLRSRRPGFNGAAGNGEALAALPLVLVVCYGGMLMALKRTSPVRALLEGARKSGDHPDLFPFSP